MRRRLPASGPGRARCFDIFLVGLALRRAGDLREALVDLNPHVGADNAGTIRVHRDPRACIFLRGGLRQRARGELGRRIHAQHGEAVMSGDRTRIDDLAFLSAILEFLRGRLDAPQHAVDIDAEDQVHVLGG